MIAARTRSDARLVGNSNVCVTLGKRRAAPIGASVRSSDIEKAAEMSQDFDEMMPPRKPKSKSKPRTAESNFEPESTFRPNPKRTTSKKRTREGDASEPRRGTGDTPNWWERIVFGSVGSGQLAQFCRQFSSYLHSGVDISKSLVSLQGQFARTALGPVIGRLSQSVKRGDTMTEAMKREPRVFDALFLGMIQVAEARGGIPETLRNLSKHYESRQRLIRQARSAMIYPIAVILVASAVVALITIVILPMFASMLKDIAGHGGELPLPSRVLMGFSDFVRSVGWFVIPTVMIGTPIVLLQMYKTKPGKDVMDRIAMRIPVFGGLLKKLDVTRFARTLGALLDAGVDVGSSLTLTSDVLRLTPYKKAVAEIRDDVIHGEEMSVALDKTGQFTPDVIAILNSGEETGKLPESLESLANEYEEQVEYTVKNLGQLVQPLLMIFMGGIVLFIILAVFLPYISMITSLAK